MSTSPDSPEKNTISIYQVLPRLFDNPNTTCERNGSYKVNGSGKLNAFTREALLAIKDLGITHIWFTGVLEHATRTHYKGIANDHDTIVKGQAGSPYSIKDYYDIDPDLAEDVEQRVEEFDDLVERVHSVGLKVIIDFVPNHVSRQYYSDKKPGFVQDFGSNDDKTLAFAPDNNFYYLPNETLKLDFGYQEQAMPYSEFPARATGNDLFHAHPTINDWYETVKLNYGVDYLNGHTTHFDPIPDTWKKMLEILDFWLYKGVDGFRCDMAEMVPTAFWRWCIDHVRRHHPQALFIAEIYQPHLYGDYLAAGFDYLYDKVGLYDTLIDVLRGYLPAAGITSAWRGLENRVDKFVRFMENHDEVRLASEVISGDGHRAFPAMVVAALFSRGPIMTYFGQEIGEPGMDSEGFSCQDGRTSIYDYWSIQSLRDWIGPDHTYDGPGLTDEQKHLRERYRRLLHIKMEKNAFAFGRFFDLMYANDTTGADLQKDYFFLRSDGVDTALVCVNFSSHPHQYKVCIPPLAFEVLKLNDNKAAKVHELISGKRGVTMLSSHHNLQVEVPPYGAAIYYMTY